MRIAIDGIAVSHPQPGGYRTYTTCLVQHLACVDTANEYRLFVDRPTPLDLGANWYIQVVPAPFRGPGVVWREQIAIPKSAAGCRANLLHSPCATGPLRPAMPLVVTVHDTIEFTEPLPRLRDARRWAMRVYSRLALAWVVKRAKLVITVSEYSKRQIMTRFGLAPDRVLVIHEAPSSGYRPVDRRLAEEQSQRLCGARDHVLAFASTAPRKNAENLMRAYASLAEGLRRNHPLVLACTHATVGAMMAARADTLGLGRDLILVEQPSDHDLLYLYNAAALFVFPSLEEGFGLPPLEAMACGIPVVASSTSSMPEVLADGALLVPPADVRVLADSMAAVLTDPLLAARLAERGLARSRQFSWEDTARQTVAVYKSVAEARR